MDDVHTAAEAGADELIVDLNLQDWFTSTAQMLEMAVEIRERAENLAANCNAGPVRRDDP